MSGPVRPAVLDGTALPPDAELRMLLAEHGVVVLRLPAKLSDDELQAVVARFGPIKDPVVADRDGELVTYAERRQVIDAGFVRTEATGDPGQGGDDVRPGLFQFFHTDDSYVAQPAAATVLHARALPTSGGDTVFLDMRAAYAGLAPDEQARLRGRTAVHAYDNGGAFPPRPAATGPLGRRLVDVAHPIVRAHPVTGVPALYFDLDRASHVAGLPVAEGRALLQRLQDHAEATAPRYAHRWQPNDVVAWDNVAVQHRASGDFTVGEPRRFWRYLVEGPVPVAA